MEQNLILYQGGCYGTFIEWLCNFVEGVVTDLPLTEEGSSHNFRGNFFIPIQKLFEHIDSGNKLKFSRCHPGLFEKVNENEHAFSDSYDKIVQKDLTFLKEHFDKILTITYDKDTILWLENNILDKVFLPEEYYENWREKYGYTKEFLAGVMTRDPLLKVRHSISSLTSSKSSPFTKQNLLGWGKENINDFEVWELRELLSMFWFEKMPGQLHAWATAKQNNPEILSVTLYDLKNDFLNSMDNIFNHFKVNVDPVRRAQLPIIHENWLAAQQQINKDALCFKIVEDIISNNYYDWSTEKLSIIDESFIQKKLAENGIQLKCYKLDVFPTNTADFQSLLER